MDDHSKLLRRDAAAEFIRDNFSIPCSARTLAKFASVGGGPRYRYSGRFPIYEVVDLTAWAAGRVGPKVGTFSESRKADA
jgi:hypothetical protein